MDSDVMERAGMKVVWAIGVGCGLLSNFLAYGQHNSLVWRGFSPWFAKVNQPQAIAQCLHRQRLLKPSSFIDLHRHPETIIFDYVQLSQQTGTKRWVWFIELPLALQIKRESDAERGKKTDETPNRKENDRTNMSNKIRM